MLNVGGCDPFRAAREREGNEHHFARRIRPRAIGTLHPREKGELSSVKRPDNVGSRYNTYFSGHLSGFAQGVRACIHLGAAKQYAVDRLERGFLLSVCTRGIIVIPQSEIPHSDDDLFA